MGDVTPEAMAKVIYEAGWRRFIVERRAPERWAMHFPEIGVVSSISHAPDDGDEWRLNLTRFGRDVRRALLAMPEDINA